MYQKNAPHQTLRRLILAFAVLGLPTAQAQYGGGSGTAEDPYLIYTPEQMDAIGQNQAHWSKHFMLMADLDLSAYEGESFHLIGYYSPVDRGAGERRVQGRLRRQRPYHLQFHLSLRRQRTSDLDRGRVHQAPGSGVRPVPHRLAFRGNQEPRSDRSSGAAHAGVHRVDRVRRRPGRPAHRDDHQLLRRGW